MKHTAPIQHHVLDFMMFLATDSQRDGVLSESDKLEHMIHVNTVVEALDIAIETYPERQRYKDSRAIVIAERGVI